MNTVSRRREYPADSLPEPVGADAPSRQTELEALRSALDDAIQALPEEQRVPLVLREYGGLSYQEIADETGLPLNTVRTRILRGRRALRSAMEAWR